MLYLEEEGGEKQSLQEVLVIGVPDIDTDSGNSSTNKHRITLYSYHVKATDDFKNN